MDTPAWSKRWSPKPLDALQRRRLRVVANHATMIGWWVRLTVAISPPPAVVRGDRDEVGHGRREVGHGRRDGDRVVRYTVNIAPRRPPGLAGLFLGGRHARTSGSLPRLPKCPSCRIWPLQAV